MALHRRNFGEQAKEIVEEIKEVIMPKDEPEKLDVFFLRDFISKQGEAGLARELTKAIDFYHKIKDVDKWDTAPKIKIKNISNAVHNEGKWKAEPGEVVSIPDFVANITLKDFPERFEVVSE